MHIFRNYKVTFVLVVELIRTISQVSIMSATRKFVKASEVASLPPLKKLLSSLERQGRVNPETQQYERFVWTFTGVFKGVNNRYNALWVQLDDETLRRVFPSDLFEVAVQAAHLPEAHFPFVVTPEGTNFKIRYNDIEKLTALKSETATYGFVEPSAETPLKVQFRAKINTYANFPEEDHVGFSIGLVSNVELVQ